MTDESLDKRKDAECNIIPAEEQISNHTNNVWRIGFVCSLIFISVVWIINACLFYSTAQDGNKYPFESINALFSGLAFAFMIYSLHQQQKSIDQQTESLKFQAAELKQQIAEMQNDRKEQVEQTKQYFLQNQIAQQERGDNLFFNLNTTLFHFIDLTNITFNNVKYTGLDAFFYIYKNLKEVVCNYGVERLSKTKFDTDIDNGITHIVQSAYQFVGLMETILEFINNSNAKIKYIEMLRSEIDPIQKVVLYYFALSPNRKNLKCQIEDSRFFSNFDPMFLTTSLPYRKNKEVNKALTKEFGYCTDYLFLITDEKGSPTKFHYSAFGMEEEEYKKIIIRRDSIINAI